MTPLVDDLRREEQRLTANLWARRLWPFGLALLMFGWGFIVGVRHPDPSLTDQAVKLALQHNADSLRAVHARLDSLLRADRTASVIAASARESVTVHRPAVSRASDAVVVSATPTDSSVRVERPAAVDAVPQDTTVVLPLAIATFIREAKPQLVRDSVALHADTLLLAVKDARIATLEQADSLWRHRDSIHADNEARLTKERDSAFRRGALRGARITLEAAAAIGGAVKLILVVARH